METRRGIGGGFFVTGGDATELLDELEEAFDDCALYKVASGLFLRSPLEESVSAPP